MSNRQYVQRYLNNARNNAHEQYLSADGQMDGDLMFTANENFFNADSGGGNMGMPKSQPYVIQISNASASAVANFDVFGAYEYIFQGAGGGTWTNGSFTLNGVTISSGLPNVTYQQLLAQSQQSPFSIGTTYIQSVAGAAGQVTQTLTVNTRDANGNQALKPLIPTINPFQNQLSVLTIPQPYRIDGYTKLTIASILASVVFTIQFYPSDNINLARGLAGNTVSRQFGNPQLSGNQVQIVGGQ
jgi:hypothetical protein